jgi:putative RNA 2'-phosphotransferase
VHLSEDIETARSVGRRRDSNPVVLKISALQAHNVGIKFYYAEEKIWLADFLPVKYIDELQLPEHPMSETC